MCLKHILIEFHLCSFFRELSVVVHDSQAFKFFSVPQEFCLQLVQLALERQTLILGDGAKVREQIRYKS